MKHRLRWSILVVTYVAAFAANLGHFWWSRDIGFLQVVTAGLYTAACIWALCTKRYSRTWMRAEMIAGGLTAAAGAVALLVRAGFTVLTLPALLLAGVFVTPLYGLLGLLQDFDWVYGAVAATGLLWWLAACRLWRRSRFESKTGS